MPSVPFPKSLNHCDSLGRVIVCAGNRTPPMRGRRILKQIAIRDTKNERESLRDPLQQEVAKLTAEILLPKVRKVRVVPGSNVRQRRPGRGFARAVALRVGS